MVAALRARAERGGLVGRAAEAIVNVERARSGRRLHGANWRQEPGTAC